ncbi:MAG: hypothetical protein QG673_1905 [Pseudomonadota bacterium]|nr:hypothetical protein [Pseudomonadota bacterium]
MLKTTNNQLLDVEELSCEEALPILTKISPELVKAIKDLPETHRYPFYKASYHFGAQIVDQKGVYLPLSNGTSILINDPLVPQPLKNGLGYIAGSSYPIGIVLNKKCEFYLQNGEKITPYIMLKPGDIFGISKTFTKNVDDTPSTCFWDLVAGARSVFMLAKISSNPQHTLIKRKYGLVSRPPTNYLNQWQVFKELAIKTDSDWRAEILFLDNKWIDLLKNSDYVALRAQILALNPPEIWHHQPSWDMAFGKIENARRLNSYPSDILDAARHLFNIVAGLFPGFAPSSDEMAAPINLLQEIYANVYELEHAAIIMEPAIISVNDKLPLFYSLNWPTSPKSVPKNLDNKKSVVYNLSILMDIVENYQIDLTSESDIMNDLEVRAPSLWKAASQAKFSFYDNEYEKYMGIKDIAALQDEDLRFACDNKSTFPSYSGFLKGLVKISV